MTIIICLVLTIIVFKKENALIEVIEKTGDAIQNFFESRAE